MASALEVNEAKARVGRAGTLFVDLRESGERTRDGVIPGSVHLPYQKIRGNIMPGGLLAALAAESGREILLYCAFGERSALALQDMLAAGMVNARHLKGGIDAWKKAGGAIEPPPARAKQG